MRFLPRALLLATATAAALPAQQPERPLSPPIVPDVPTSTPATTTRCWLSQLSLGTLTGRGGESRGCIQDIVFDLNSRLVTHLVLGLEDVERARGPCLVIPWHLVRIQLPQDGGAPQAASDLTDRELAAAPRFEADELMAALQNGDSSIVEGSFDARHPRRPREAASKSEPATVRNHASLTLLSAFFGREVVDAHDRTLATAEDVVIEFGDDSDAAVALAVLVSFDGDLGVGERLAIVPTASLAFGSTSSGSAMELPCSAAGLAAMQLEPVALPVLADDAWLERARDLCAKACSGRAADSAATLHRDRSVPTTAPADAYDLAKVVSIAGKVRTIGLVHDGEGEARLRLRIDMEGERSVIVYAAPTAFQPQLALRLRHGDEVKVTGAPLSHRTQTVLVAGSITSAGKSAKLRDDAGRPLWIKE